MTNPFFQPSSLRQRDGKLIENWYIACLSRELKKKPLYRLVYDESLVLFRDNNGNPTALPDRCLHRGVKLSEGRCRDGNIQCPYHGWTYDASGRVVHIPSEGPQAVKRELILPARICREQDGAIWVWMGSGAPTTPEPPWRFPNADDPNWSKYFMITDFDNEVTHLAENFMDVPHTIFVHDKWFRSAALREVPIRLEVGKGRVLVTYQQPNDSIGWTNWLLNPHRQPMVHTDEFIFPNVTRVDYRFGDSHGFIINSQCTPVSTLKSRVYTYIAYRTGRLTRLLNPLFRFYTRVVIEQDVVIMRNQGENFPRHEEEAFRSTDADEIHLAIERIRELGAKGDSSLYSLIKNKEKSFWI